ncbi:MAG TPA: hypothetical protein DCF42_02325 [Lachnospiraceae bacterium]|nr:hypothetical protein [Lachnospiraceae bacterium]
MKYAVCILLLFCAFMTEIPVKASDSYPYAFSSMEVQDELYRNAGVIYTEVRQGFSGGISFSEDENYIAVVKGSYVNLYDNRTGRFLCGFYSKTDHSSLTACLHNDWIEISNSNGRYFAYQLDGTLLCCAELTKDSQQIREFGGYDSVTKAEEEHSMIGNYFSEQRSHPLIHAEPEAEIPETHISFELQPVPETVPALQNVTEFHDEYSVLRYSADSAGTTLIQAGDYLHLYHPDGYYQQSFFLGEFSRKKPVPVLYADCIQIYYQSENLLVSYDRTDGSVLSVGILTDSEQNQQSLKEFKARCFSEDAETGNAEYWFSRNQLTRIQNQQYLILYQMQNYTGEQNFSRVYGIFFLTFSGMILINHLKDKKQQEQ